MKLCQWHLIHNSLISQSLCGVMNVVFLRYATLFKLEPKLMIWLVRHIYIFKTKNTHLVFPRTPVGLFYKK